MNRLFAVAVGWALLPVLSLTLGGCSGGEVPFEHVATGGLPGPGARLVLDQAALDELWAGLYGAGPKPAVDWEQHAVLGVFLGQRPTGGYSVRVERVVLAGGKLLVTVRTSSPGPADMVTMAFTYPGDLVRIERSHLGVSPPHTVAVYDQMGRLLFTSGVGGR